MARLAIDLRTNYTASQINHVDISIWDVNDVNNPQYRILTSFTESMDLERGVRLNTFGGLSISHSYVFVTRIFLNEAPYFKIRSLSVTLSEEITVGLVVITR